MNADLKFSFWQDVILQHPWYSLLVAVGFFAGISAVCYFYADDLRNTANIHMGMYSLQAEMTREIVKRLDYIIATQTIIQEALKKGEEFTQKVLDLQLEFAANIGKMGDEINWRGIETKIQNLATAGKNNKHAMELVHAATFQVSELRKRVAAYPNEDMKRVINDLRFDNASNAPASNLNLLLNAAKDFLNVARKLKHWNAERTVADYHNYLKIQQEAKQPAIGFLEWIETLVYKH